MNSIKLACFYLRTDSNVRSYIRRRLRTLSIGDLCRHIFEGKAM